MHMAHQLVVIRSGSNFWMKFLDIQGVQCRRIIQHYVNLSNFSYWKAIYFFIKLFSWGYICQHILSYKYSNGWIWIQQTHPTWRNERLLWDLVSHEFVSAVWKEYIFCCRGKEEPWLFLGPPNCEKFNAITLNLQLNNNAAPAYWDKIWSNHQLIESFNNRMGNNFEPSWKVCFYESMISFLAQIV